MKSVEAKLLRIIDANFNRAKEGFRVCEDVCRFWCDDGKASRVFKNLRHRLTQAIFILGFKEILSGRDVDADRAKTSSRPESRRTNIEDVFYANSQRVKESLRVLEEFAKLKDPRVSRKIKTIRYEVYRAERTVLIEGK